MGELDLSVTPAAAPPPGHFSNLVNPDTEFHFLLPTCIISWIFTVPAVLIRLFTKLRVHGRLQYEDYILTLALVALIVWTILLLVQPTQGAHIWDTSAAELPEFAYWSNLIIILYVPSILLAKWAILLQLSRIFSVQPRTGTWWMIRALIWTSTLFYFTVFWVDVFACVPREKIWNMHIPGTCTSVSGVLISTSFFNIVLNCTIIALPLIILRRLQLQLSKKLTVCAIFAFAILSGLSSVIRAVYSIIFASNNDMTRTIFPVAMWAVAEISFINIGTTLPTMPLFVVYVRHGLEAARRRIGFADKSLAARGGDGSTNQGSMRQNSITGHWYAVGGSSVSSPVTSGNSAPWEAIKMPALPNTMAMTAVERESDSRGTAASLGAELGGENGTARHHEAQVRNMV